MKSASSNPEVGLATPRVNRLLHATHFRQKTPSFCHGSKAAVSRHMKLPLISAFALISFVAYLNATKHQTEFAVSTAHVEGYSSASIIESSQDNTDLYFAFRAARGDGMTAAGVRVRGELRPGALDGADIEVTQQWRPHAGGWSGSQAAERVVAQVKELGDGSMQVDYVAYFDVGVSHGAFVVPPTLNAK